jgi:hypothetical protein
MGFLGDRSREYMRHRAYGGRHRYHRGSMWRAPHGGWGSPRHHGHWMGRRHQRGPFVAHRPRRRVEVRGCGCCLPIPLALIVGGALGAREAIRRRAR